MKGVVIIWLLIFRLCFELLFPGDYFGESVFAADQAQTATRPVLEKILTGVEQRYSPIGFSASFKQTSTIKAMDITDSASGRITVKRPGKMRWEYDQPEPQQIITDGITLWFYKPEDHQVLVGTYPTFFGDGKGASFLSDMRLIRKKFTITLESVSDNGDFILKLMPQDKSVDISKIFLLISHRTFDITQITTYNSDNDETRITLENIQFHHELDDSLFQFHIGNNVDVLQLDE